MDDLSVSHFESGGDAFHVEEPHDRVQVGAVLLGSLAGKWATHQHSMDAVHVGESGEHNRGGVAYVRRVTALATLADGSTRVETSRDIGGVQLFPKGGFALDFNATEVRQKRRLTDAEALQAFLDARGPSNDGGDNDSDAIARATSLFGGENEEEGRRNVKQGFCDSQCKGTKYFNDFKRKRLDGDDEFCFYCFEYDKE